MTRREFLGRTAAATGGLWGASVMRAAGAGQAAPSSNVQYRELRDGAAIFTGRGGTIGCLVSAGVGVMVDTQFPESAGLCLDEIKERAGHDAQVVLNTHHHADHTSGNVVVQARGIKRIVAQERVPELQRAAAARRKSEAPVVVANETFPRSWEWQAGEETVTAEHFGPAHTGGDSIVHFQRSNVVHMGDLIFNRLHPVIDLPGGGSIRGWIRVLETAVDRYPEDAIYIFGHGQHEVTGARNALPMMRDYLSRLIETVEADVAAGKSLPEVKSRPELKGFEDWGGEARLPSNLESAYRELTKGPPEG